jgi:hypothetical protein
MFLKAVGHNFWALLKGYRKAAWKCPNIDYQPIGEEAELARGYWQKLGNLHLFPLKCCISVCINKKLKTHCKILKTLSSSSSNRFVSLHKIV